MRYLKTMLLIILPFIGYNTLAANSIKNKPIEPNSYKRSNSLWSIAKPIAPPSYGGPYFATFSTDTGGGGSFYGLEILFYNSSPCNETSFYQTSQIALFGPSAGNTGKTFGITPANMQNLTPCTNVGTGGVGYVTIIDTQNPTNSRTCQAYNTTTCTLGITMPSAIESGPQQYTVTPTTVGSGSITPYYLQPVHSNGSVSFSGTPSAGNNIYWYLDNVLESSITSYNLTSVTANHTVQTIFSLWAITTGLSNPGALNAVSCPTASFCMAVAGSGDAYIFNGTTWSSSTTVSANPLNAVSCPSDTFCMALDGAGNAYSYNGTSWSSATLVNTGSNFKTVSCPSSSFCAAGDSSGNAFTYSSGGGWSTATSLSPTQPINSVSCPTSGFCMAGNDTGMVFNYLAGTWDTGTQVINGSRITSVSCPTTSFCMAATDGFVIYNYNGAAWISSLTEADYYNINNVSCANTSFCVAIDGLNNAFVYSISSWAAPEPTASANNNNGISCPTSTFCMAVDSGGYAQEYAP